MDAGKFVQLQQQMKLNQAEMQDSFKDLDSWLSDIKQKDESLKDKIEKTPQELPPVRNSLQKKKKKKTKKKSEGAKPKSGSGRISGYDFQSWDKFDAEKACEGVDANSESSESEYETDEEWEEIRKKQQANLLKDQGNQYLKEGKLDEAITCYTRGIQCDPDNGILPANRAMALLKQDKFGAAELDCSAAIMIDPTYIKSYLRRGTARIGLKKYIEAKSDFQRVLSLEPVNKLAKNELEKLEKLLNPPKFSISTEGEAGIVKPIYIPPEKRSKKPLHRLVIEEVGDAGIEAVTSAKQPQSETTRKMVDRDNQDFRKFISTEKQPEANKPMINGSSNITQITSPADISSLHSKVETVPEGYTPSELKLDFNSTNEEDLSSKQSSNVKSSTKAASPQTSPRLPPTPTTSYQFQTDWKVLKNTKEQFYAYLRQIDPVSYPKLFGQFLDADILLKIIHTLNDCYIPDNIEYTSVLEHLPLVKRFDMTVMFLSANDKNSIKKLIDLLEAKCGTDLCTKLKKQFQL